MKNYYYIALLFLNATGGDTTVSAEKSRFPELPDPADTSGYGRGIERSMRLMETTEPKKRNRFKILYCGQSIMGHRWSDQVDVMLRKRYPHIDFVTKNLAIGGFNSERLVRTMECDVFPFYPDLVVFHVYGSHIKYEEIIRAIRSRTTAEVIVQTGRANKWPEAKTEHIDDQREWHDKMIHWFLPQIAQKYGCGLQPQVVEWAQYVRHHKLQPQDKPPTTDGWEVTWKTNPMFADSFSPKAGCRSQREAITVFVSKRKPGRHIPELVSDGSPVTSLKSLRIHQPAIQIE